MIAKIDLVLERRLIDTGLDLVNTADFSLVSIQPYEHAYHAHPSYRIINNLYHILLL